MKTKNLLIIGTMCFALSAFVVNNDTNLKTGVFGGDGHNAPQITLQKDGSFIYKDLTNQKKPIETKGIYEVKGEKLILSGYQSKNKIENEWKIVNEGKCIKAKKNFAFYTLCTDCK